MNEKRLKVLQLGKFYPILGGVEKVAYDLMVGLTQHQLDCDMLCAACEGGSRVIPVNGHARVIVCRTWLKAASTMISPGMIFRLRRICRQYDIIHVHHPDPMAALALFLSGYRGRVILHWHSDIQKQRLLLAMYRPLQTWLLRRADRIVGTSPVYLAGSPFLQPFRQKTVCIPIGTDPVCPDPADVARLRARYAGRKIVFSLGRLVAYKGYFSLVEAARYLSDEYVVLIGGSGPLLETLRNRVGSLDLRDRVEFVERIPDEELPAYFGACDVFCLSSVQKTEAFGIVQIEAMSCGKPVVATDIPQSGVSWVNAHGVSGLNVTPDRPRELARAIEEVVRQEAIDGRYSEGARRRYRELFTREQMILKCLKTYGYER